MIPAMTERTQAGRHRRLPQEVRRQQVLHAATAEFGSVGYAAASLADIAARVGVSKALVLTYFGTKEELYAACAARAGAPLVAAVEQVITTPQPPAAMAAATLEAIFTTLEEEPHGWNVINDRALPRGGPGDVAGRTVRRTIAEQASRGISGIDDLAVHDADDLAIVTDVWMSTVSAMVNWWLRHPDRTAAEMTERSARLVDLLVGASTSERSTP